jgi:hypothetical protein
VVCIAMHTAGATAKFVEARTMTMDSRTARSTELRSLEQQHYGKLLYATKWMMTSGTSMTASWVSAVNVEFLNSSSASPSYKHRRTSS